MQLSKFRRKRLANRAMDSIKATFTVDKSRQSTEPVATPTDVLPPVVVEPPKRD